MEDSLQVVRCHAQFYAELMLGKALLLASGERQCIYRYPMGIGPIEHGIPYLYANYLSLLSS